MARYTRPLAAGLAAMALVVGAACSSTSSNSSTGTTTGSTAAATQAASSSQPARVQTGKEMTTADLVKYAEPAVVRIQTTLSNGFGVGTGFIVDGNGYIVTNQHVIDGARGTGGSSGVTVTTNDGAQYNAKIQGSDARSDLALLKIDASGLKALPLGNLDNIAVGQDVVAIGFALDLTGGEDAPFTVTRGIVSAKNRPIVEGGTSPSILGGVQTDAAINHGNSGGPLLDLFGNVIGVNTALAADDSTGGVASGIGFAVGANTVSAVYDQLKSTGSVSRGFLGIQYFESLRPAKAKELGIPDGTRGVYLPTQPVQTTRGSASSVVAGGPADKGGVKSGDVITRVGDTPIGDESELAIAMIKHHPNEKVSVEVYRDGKKTTMDVTLGTPTS